jgi:hypothetical protein
MGEFRDMGIPAQVIKKSCTSGEFFQNFNISKNINKLKNSKNSKNFKKFQKFQKKIPIPKKFQNFKKIIARNFHVPTYLCSDS